MRSRCLAWSALAVLALSGCTGSPAAEVEYVDYPGPVWRDGERRAVSAEVLNVIRGPEHCGWGSAAILHVGWPLGRESENISQARLYVRDPHGVLPKDAVSTPGDLAAILPEDAQASGYATDGLELWISRSEIDEAVYLVTEGGVERWPRAEEFACE